MSSWIKRIGLIVPGANVTIEPEAYSIIPREISIHSSRAISGVYTSKTNSLVHLDNLVKEIPRCSLELTHANVDVIAFSCTGASFYKGNYFDRQLCQLIEKETGILGTTTTTAVVNSLKRLNVKKIALATPYDEYINKLEVEFLENNNFEVISSVGLGERDGKKIANFSLKDAQEISIAANKDEAECVFISCTNFETFKIIPSLIKKLEKPIISSNLATIWETLCLIQYKEFIDYDFMINLFPK